MEGTPKAQKERLSTIEMPNTVVWVNDKLKAPFDIRLGEQSKLGVLLALDGEEGKGFPGIPREYHWRSLDIGKVYFEDVDHRLYRDVDMKGTGLLAGDIQAEHRTQPIKWFFRQRPPDMRGLLDKTEAIHDAEMSELFTEFGMRTHRTIAVIAFEELNVAPGKQLPIESLKTLGEVADGFDPAVEVRAFGTKTRVGDLFPTAHPQQMSGADFLAELRKQDMSRLAPADKVRVTEEIEDTLEVLGKEFGKPLPLKEYLPWFIAEVGRNVGIMHNAGYVHQFLHAQNITLDGRLTDFDTAFHLSEMEKQQDLSPQEIKEDQEATLFDELNYHPQESYGQAKALLDWLEPYAVMLQNMHPEELSEFDTTQTNTVFFQNYWQQLTNENIRSMVRMFMEGNNISIPDETR